MILHSDPLFDLYFGDQRDSFFRHQFYDIQNSDELLSQKQFVQAKKIMHIKQLVVLKQTHSAAGFSLQTVTDAQQLPPYYKDGDYLITNIAHIGLGVASADCLPIIFLDSQTNTIAIAHAGWLGSVQQIAIKTIEHMQRDFGTELGYLKVFFGPSARACCYEVTEDFLKNLESFSCTEQVIQQRNNHLYFDLPLFNRLQLENLGVQKASFHMNYNICTMCNPSFCSHRRDGTDSKRQMTIVALK